MYEVKIFVSPLFRFYFEIKSVSQTLSSHDMISIQSDPVRLSSVGHRSGSLLIYQCLRRRHIVILLLTSY